MEATQVSIIGWMDKQNVLYTYNGVLSSLKKEGNSDICFNMNDPEDHYAKWNKSQKDKYCMIPFIWNT